MNIFIEISQMNMSWKVRHIGQKKNRQQKVFINNKISDIKDFKVSAINIFTDLNERMNKLKGSMRRMLNQLQNINKFSKKAKWQLWS